MMRSVARCLLSHRSSPVRLPRMLEEGFVRRTSTLCSPGVGIDTLSIEKLQDFWQTDVVLRVSQQGRGFLSVGDGDEENDRSRHHEEHRLIGYSPEQIYAVVAAVDLYEDFVPWCRRSTVIWHRPNEAMEAELETGFKFFLERYISHVELIGLVV